jgi:hypothetical protein
MSLLARALVVVFGAFAAGGNRGSIASGYMGRAKDTEHLKAFVRLTDSAADRSEGD